MDKFKVGDVIIALRSGANRQFTQGQIFEITVIFGNFGYQMARPLAFNFEARTVAFHSYTIYGKDEDFELYSTYCQPPTSAQHSFSLTALLKPIATGGAGGSGFAGPKHDHDYYDGSNVPSLMGRIKCECGSHIISGDIEGPGHSSWCPQWKQY